MIVTITPDEIHLASSHGLLRRFMKMSGKRADRIQKEKSSWDNEIEGACAELAFCKMRGIYWSGVGGIKAKDGGGVEVRWTRHEGSGGLIVYPHDDDDAYFVLIDGFAPTFNLVGYLRGEDAKREEWLTSFGYLAPRESLMMFERAK